MELAACTPQQQASGSQATAVLFGVGPLDFAMACTPQPAFILSSDAVGQISFSMPQLATINASTVDLEFILTLDKASNQAHLCSSGAMTSFGLPAALHASTGSFLNSTAFTPSMLSSGVTIGARDDSMQSVRADIRRFMLRTDSEAADCTPTAMESTNWSSLNSQDMGSADSLPQILYVKSDPPGDAVVGQEVVLSAAASDPNGDPTRLALTVYGLPAASCMDTACDNAKFQATGAAGQVVKVSAAVQFLLPGRYIVRAQASDGLGEVVTQDLAVVVRKTGDTQKNAACCRHTAYITAQQIGRPIDQMAYRSAAVQQGAGLLGWSPVYMVGADLEAERLFDYGILAPPPQLAPLSLTTCADSRLAGAGSPVVFGVIGREDDVTGHNKALTIVPEAFPWALASDTECQQHWSGWQNASPYARATPSSSGNGTVLCSVGCTKNGTDFLIRTTGTLKPQCLGCICHMCMASACAHDGTRQFSRTSMRNTQLPALQPLQECLITTTRH